MSTVGVELTKFINPDLTWKVAKGYRRSLRRTRKPATRSDTDVELSDEGTRKADVLSASDTEKHGVAVLGHHFSEEIEHVPIKKRRIITQPPSLKTQMSSPCFEVTDPNSSRKRRRRAIDASKITKLSGMSSGASDSTRDSGEDFSGIEILAAVACNNSLFNHVDHGKESLPTEESTQGVGSSTSAVPSEVTAGSALDLGDGDKLEASLPEDGSTAVSPKSPTVIKDTIPIEVTTSLQDERLLWDLNAVPCDNLWDDPQVDAQHSISVGRGAMLQDMGNCEVHEGCKDTRKTPLDGLMPLEVRTDDPSFNDLKVESCWPYRSSIDQVETESVLHRNCDKLVSSTIVIAQEHSMSDVADVKASSKVLDTDDYSRAGISMKSRGTSPSSLTVNQSTDVSSSDIQLRKFSSMKSIQIERCYAADSHLLEVERVGCETATIALNEEGEKSRVAFGLHEDEKSIQDMIHRGESGDHHCSLSNEDISASGESGLEGQHVAVVDVERQVNGVSGANTTGVESPEAVVSEELMQHSCVESIATTREAHKVNDSRLIGSLAAVVKEDPSDESYGLDVYQANKVCIPGTKKDVELQAGYDSQFEDGELRESECPYHWDENEGEDEDIENVDYGSECEEETLCVSGGKEIRFERGSSPGSGNASRKSESCGTGDAGRDDSVSPKTRTSDVMTGKDFPSVVAGSSASDRELQSSVKGPDANHWNDAIITSRADSSYNLHSRDAREATSKKLMGRDNVASHMCGRSPGGHRSVNPSAGYWQPERDYLPYSSIPTRPKSVIGNRGYTMASENAGHEIARFAGFDHCSHKQFNNSNPYTGHERKMRRCSPVNRDYGYDNHVRRLAVGEVSPTRNRFRSQQGLGRGIREEYHRRMKLENIGYPNRMSHRLAKRERSISPFGRVRPHYAMAHRKSQSRSRSRSPASYSRLRSRSPNFRSDTRMERPRLHFRKHFSEGYEEGLFSLARSNFSPQQNTRWFDVRNSASDSCRGRRPAVRMFRQVQRFETVDPIRRFESVHPRRLNLDEEFSPTMQSRKFANVEVAGREVEYEGSDYDRKKRSSKYEAVHRGRRYDADEAVQWSRLQSRGFFCG